MVGRSRYSLPLSPSLEQKFAALVGGARRARARELGRRQRDGSALHARPADPAARPRRARVLRAAAVSRRARAARVQARRRARAGRAGGGARRPRAEARARADAGDRGHPRRPCGAGAAVRLAAAQGARAARGRARALRAAAERRRADDLGVHVAARSRGRCRADGRVRRLHGSRAVRRVASPCRCRSGPSRSSSACSSATRPWTCSRRRGGSPRRACRTRRCTWSAAGPCARSPRALVRDLPAQTRWTESLSTPEVARALDEATVLVLPSRSEGLGRVVVEAFCRGRGVVGSRVGGIPDIVEDGVSGMLVPPEDATALADALVRVLSDRALAERLGAAAHAAVQPWLATPEEYARRIRELVDEVTSVARLHSRDARGPGQAAPEERRLSRDRRDRQRRRRPRRRRRADAARAHVPQGQRPARRTRPRFRRAVFAEQMALLGDLGYVPVSLEQVRDHYVDAAPLPPGAVLITFDDGYRDNLAKRAADPAASTAIRRSSSSRSAFSTAIVRCRTRRRFARSASATRRSAGTSSRSSRRAGFASSRTGSGTGRSPSSSRPRPRARSRSRSSGSRSGSAARSRRTRS